MIGSMGANLNPIFGITSIPMMGSAVAHPMRMTVRDVLAANLKKLGDATPTLNRPKDMVEAGAGTNGTIHRIATKKNGASIDTVEQLARAYGIEPWQMLVPTLEARPGKDGKPVVTGLPLPATAQASRPEPSLAASILADVVDWLDDPAAKAEVLHIATQEVRVRMLRAGASQAQIDALPQLPPSDTPSPPVPSGTQRGSR